MHNRVMQDALAAIGEPLYANRSRPEHLPRLGGSGSGSAGRRVKVWHEESHGSLLEVTTNTDQSRPHYFEVQMWIARLLNDCVPYHPTFPLQLTVHQLRTDIRVLGRRRSVKILTAGPSWVCAFKVGDRRVELFGRQFDPLNVDLVRLTSTQIESIRRNHDEWLTSLDPR